MDQATTDAKPEGGSKQVAPEPHSLFQALLPHAHRLVPMLVAMLLVTEAILAAVVIFSRMSAFQQFVCVVLIVVLPAAVLALAVSSLARLGHAGTRNGISDRLAPPILPLSQAASSALWIEKPEVYDLSVIAEQLEAMSMEARWLPLNFVRGLDEEQFTYLVVKLRATASALAERAPTSPSRGLLEDGAPVFAQEQIERIQEGMRVKKPLEAGDPVSDAPAPTPAAEPAEREPESTQPSEAEYEPTGESVTAAVEESPPVVDDRPILTVNEARESLRQGDSRAAIDGLKAIMENEPDNAEAAELLGIAYERAGDLESAIEAMRQAVLANPGRASSHYNYAVLLSKADRLLDAYRQNEVAVRLNPQYAAAREFEKSLQNRLTAAQTSGKLAPVSASEPAGAR